MAGGAATSPFTSGCHVVVWWIGCVGCGPICGGRRRRPEPEASPEANGQGRWDCTGSTGERGGKTAVEVTTRTAKAGAISAISQNITAITYLELSCAGLALWALNSRSRCPTHRDLLYTRYRSLEAMRPVRPQAYLACRARVFRGREVLLRPLRLSGRSPHHCAVLPKRTQKNRRSDITASFFRPSGRYSVVAGEETPILSLTIVAVAWAFSD